MAFDKRWTSWFYTYNYHLYGEYENNTFKSIIEIVDDMWADFCGMLNEEGHRFIDNTDNAEYTLYNAMLLETIKRSGIYIDHKGSPSLIKIDAEHIKIKYDYFNFMLPIVNTFIEDYVQILEFNKEFYKDY